MEKVFHTLEPVYDENSRVLILGTMPSPKSREEGFYYAHPQNRFWRVLSAVLDDDFPKCTEQRRDFVLRHNIALWDVLSSCDIEGAADSSIKNPVPNDIAGLVKKTGIVHIFTTGAAAYKLYNKYCAKDVDIDVTPLASTSAANAAMSIKRLVEEYGVIYNALREA